MKVPQPKLNVIELAMIGGLLVFLGFLAGAQLTRRQLYPFLSGGRGELEAISQRYGGTRSSDNGEEWLLRDFFQDERNGVFVDVGANHYEHGSNTYYLETALEWSGIAIEPQPKFAADYQTHRPRTRFIPLFVSDTSNRDAILYVGPNDLLASATHSVAAFGARNEEVVPLHVNTTTLDDILDRSGIRTFDFLSMDIEQHEPQALKGFSIERYRPRLVCVEAHEAVRQQILDYFAAHGYTVIGKYLRADTENLWFQPASPLPVDR